MLLTTTHDIICTRLLRKWTLRIHIYIPFTKYCPLLHQPCSSLRNHDRTITLYAYLTTVTAHALIHDYTYKLPTLVLNSHTDIFRTPHNPTKRPSPMSANEMIHNSDVLSSGLPTTFPKQITPRLILCLLTLQTTHRIRQCVPCT